MLQALIALGELAVGSSDVVAVLADQLDLNAGVLDDLLVGLQLVAEALDFFLWGQVVHTVTPQAL